jgi:hypothetical protein
MKIRPRRIAWVFAAAFGIVALIPLTIAAAFLELSESKGDRR